MDGSDDGRSTMHGNGATTTVAPSFDDDHSRLAESGARGEAERILRAFDYWLTDLRSSLTDREAASIAAQAMRQILLMWEDALAAYAEYALTPDDEPPQATMQESEVSSAPVDEEFGGAATEEPSANGAAPRLFEKNVSLRIGARASVRQIAAFLSELRQESRMRVLQMTNEHADGARITVALLRPLALCTLLTQMAGVSRIVERAAPREAICEPVLDVYLAA